MGQPTGLDLYPYNPSTAATAIFAVLYGLLAIYHSYLCFIYSRSVSYKHRYTIPLVVAACFSTAGYATRAASIKSPGNISLYAISSSWIVISPIFVCASLYLLVAHLIRRCLPAEHQSFFKVSSRWIGRLFITSDVLSFLTQASGSGVAASGNWQGNLKIVGTDVLLVGLALQLATFTFFLLVTWRFVCRVRALNTIEFDIATKRVLKGVWIASAFVEVSHRRSKTVTCPMGLEVWNAGPTDLSFRGIDSINLPSH